MADICMVAKLLLDVCEDLKRAQDKLLRMEDFAEPGSHPRRLSFEIRRAVSEVLGLCKDENVLYPYKQILRMCNQKNRGGTG